MGNQNFDSLSYMLVQHDKTFGKRKNLGEYLPFTNSMKVESSKERGSPNENTKGRGSFNVDTRGWGTYNENTQGRGSFSDNYRERRRNQDFICGRGIIKGRGRNDQNKKYFRISQ